MVAVALLFLVKAVILGFWVTPLWDVPDETGHYAIVADLSEGKGLPLPGKSVVPPDVMADWMHDRAPESPMSNWVAQHPPLYHLLAAPLLSAARAVTRDPRWLYRAPRLFSAVSGAAALLLFFLAFLEASGDPLLSFAAAAAVGFLPMYSHMASGTNHDIFLAFSSGLVALCWVRFERSGLFSDGMKTAAALSLAGLVKLSAVPVAAALWLLCFARLRGRGGRGSPDGSRSARPRSPFRFSGHSATGGCSATHGSIPFPPSAFTSRASSPTCATNRWWTTRSRTSSA